MKGLLATLAVSVFSFNYATAQSCDAPEDSTLTASNIGTMQATVSWAWDTAKATPQGYDYYFSTNNTAPDTISGKSSGTSISLRGLTPNTTYYFWVRSQCGDTTYSAWSAPLSFTTLCDSNFAQFASDTISFCGEDTIILKTNFSDSDAVYLWSNGSTDSNIVLSKNDLGNYNLQVIDKYGCVTNDTVEIVDGPKPTLNGITQQYLGVNRYSFAALVDSTVHNYHWDFGDGNTSTEATPTHGYRKSGISYVVTATVSNYNTCTSSMSITVDYLSFSIDETNSNKQIVLYPNPASNFVMVKNNSTERINTISIYNVLGQKVYHSTNNETQINVAHLTDGIYNIRVELSNGETVQNKIQIRK